jgi:hypothetical protein
MGDLERIIKVGERNGNLLNDTSLGNVDHVTSNFSQNQMLVHSNF